MLNYYLIYPLVHVYKGIQNLIVMKVLVGMSTYATKKCGTSVDCSNLQLTSKGWVAKFGSIVSVGMQAHEPNLHWPQPTVVFSMNKIELSAANRAFGPHWQIDTLYLPDTKPFSTKSLEVCVDTIDF